jgi:hypothetical protein
MLWMRERSFDVGERSSVEELFWSAELDGLGRGDWTPRGLSSDKWGGLMSFDEWDDFAVAGLNERREVVGHVLEWTENSAGKTLEFLLGDDLELFGFF